MNNNPQASEGSKSSLVVEQLCIRIDGTDILSDVSLSLRQGEIGCLLGPSGCGKTTLLRSIAGFIAPSGGKLMLAGKTVSDHDTLVPVEKRHVGMVFQDFALFPHLTVLQNILFGLDTGTKQQKNERAQALLSLIDLSDKGGRFPHELSGGQQQRVALARALAPKPSIILLDEPFSSIDSAMREKLAFNVREILKKENATTVMVTHDQGEAYAMADKIGVMSAGKLHQWNSPYHIYHQPVDLFVAGFVGEGVFIDATAVAHNQVSTCLGQISTANNRFSPAEIGKQHQLLVRPDDVIHDDASSFQATVIRQFFRGASFIYLLELDTGEHVYAHASSHHNHNQGERIGIGIDICHVVLF